MTTTVPITWHDIAKWGVEGKGWSRTQRRYDRLPLRAKGRIPPTVWDLSHSPTGLCTLFTSNASRIHARWVLESPLTNSWIKPAQMAFHRENWKALRDTYRRLRREGFRNLAYVKGESILGDDNEASLDSSHPSDLGYMRMAEILFPVIRKLLR